MHAEVELPALVGSNMVLQQNEKVVFWGWAMAGEKVSVKAEWMKKTIVTTTTANGEWKLTVKTPEAGGPYTIKVKGENEITLSNVLIGDVWICSGQSNMHMPVGRTENNWRTGVLNASEEIENADYPNIRLFTVDRITSDTLLNDVQGEWLTCNPESIYEFSAVGYFFGREIHQTQQIPIGLINCTWGGTTVEAWMKKSVLEKDDDFKPILSRFEQQCIDYPESIKQFRIDYKQWQSDRDSLKEIGKKVRSAPRQPIGPGSNKAPNLIYNGMVYPMLNCKIKGVIWYQGENNARRAYQYRTLFPAMIKNWRNDFNSGNFPFYFVQIAPHRSQNPEIREAQLMTFQSVKKTGITVITDAGDSTNIHPLNKQVVGHRLSLWARANTYKEKDLIYSGPMYQSMKVDDNIAVLSFNYIGSGLVCKGDNLSHFTVCGADSVFVPAEAVIYGDKVIVSAPNVDKPLSVRFGWEYIPMPNFFNKEGLPASPFRTDDWPGVTFNAR